MKKCLNPKCNNLIDEILTPKSKYCSSQCKNQHAWKKRVGEITPIFEGYCNCPYCKRTFKIKEKPLFKEE